MSCMKMAENTSTAVFIFEESVATQTCCETFLLLLFCVYFYSNFRSSVYGQKNVAFNTTHMYELVGYRNIKI